VNYFTLVRLYSAFEVLLFSGLLVVWLGDISAGAKTVLGWSHGVGWIILCCLVYAGCVRRVFPWWLLAASVSPLGPVGSTIGLEFLARRKRQVAS
jgi:uncharacterized membrane protein